MVVRSMNVSFKNLGSFDRIMSGSTNPFMKNRLASIKKIREFIFGDLDKTIELDVIKRPKSSESYGAHSYTIALSLCCHTESCGKLIEGVS